MPSVIDVTGATGFVDLPVVHGPALRLVTDENCIAAAAAKEHNSQRQFCIARAAQRLGELCATSFVSKDMSSNLDGDEMRKIFRMIEILSCHMLYKDVYGAVLEHMKIYRNLGLSPCSVA